MCKLSGEQLTTCTCMCLPCLQYIVNNPGRSVGCPILRLVDILVLASLSATYVPWERILVKFGKKDISSGPSDGEMLVLESLVWNGLCAFLTISLRTGDKNFGSVFSVRSNSNKTGTSCCRYWRVVMELAYCCDSKSRMVWSNLSDGWTMAQTDEELAKASTNFSHSLGHLLCVPFISIVTKCCTKSFKNGACLSIKPKSSSTSHPLQANCERQVRVFLWDIKTRSLYLVIEETQVCKLWIKHLFLVQKHHLSSTSFFRLGHFENQLPWI